MNVKNRATKWSIFLALWLKGKPQVIGRPLELAGRWWWSVLREWVLLGHPACMWGGTAEDVTRANHYGHSAALDTFLDLSPCQLNVCIHTEASLASPLMEVAALLCQCLQCNPSCHKFSPLQPKKISADEAAPFHCTVAPPRSHCEG